MLKQIIVSCFMDKQINENGEAVGEFGEHVHSSKTCSRSLAGTLNTGSERHGTYYRNAESKSISMGSSSISPFA